MFADALADTAESGDDNRRKIREGNLLGKPVAQECLVRAFVRLTGAPSNMSASETCDGLNSLPWDISEESVRRVWQRVLWNGGVDGGKIITKNRVFATEMIAYLAGERTNEEARGELLEEYRRQFPEEERSDLDLPEVR